MTLDSFFREGGGGKEMQTREPLIRQFVAVCPFTISPVPRASKYKTTNTYVRANFGTGDAHDVNGKCYYVFCFVFFFLI